MRGEIDKSINEFGDLHTPTQHLMQQPYRKSTTNQQNLTVIEHVTQNSTTYNTFFANAHRTYIKIDMSDRKTNLNN